MTPTRSEYLDTLQNLTKVTRDSLHDVEGDLWLPWAAAQQINARQKVDQSIRYVLSAIADASWALAKFLQARAVKVLSSLGSLNPDPCAYI